MTPQGDRPDNAALDRSALLAESVPEAVLHLRAAVRSGIPWQQALLQAVGLWTVPAETYHGRSYQYLLQGEAFDWLTLAERLCQELDGAVPAEEKERLLFLGQLGEEVSAETFRDLLGGGKHRAFLNYWYGVVVEEALQLAVEQEVRKRHLARGFADSEELVEEAFRHLYGSGREDLLVEFRQQHRLPLDGDLSLTNLKEFTYWVFKRRLRIWDPARVASDTQRGIEQLKLLGQSMAPGANTCGDGDTPPPWV